LPQTISSSKKTALTTLFFKTFNTTPVLKFFQIQSFGVAFLPPPPLYILKRVSQSDINFKKNQNCSDELFLEFLVLLL